MNVEDLVRQSMTERAADVADSPTIGRAGRAREQARVMRVRRNAGAAISVAAVAAIAAGVVGSGVLRADPTPEPAPQPSRTIEVVDSFAGRTLITSEETHGGEPLFLSVDAPAGSQWMVTCAGLGPEYVVHTAVDEKFEDTAPCGPLDVIGQSLNFRWDSDDPIGKVREFSVWITRDGQAVQPEGAILAAAVYALPSPVTQLAGSDIEPVELALGQEWAYLDSASSRPGERVLTKRFGATDEDVILELVTDPIGSSASVSLAIDGEPAGSPATFPLGGTSSGDRLAPGEPHTVTLRIVGDVPSDARLAIVRRTLAP